MRAPGVKTLMAKTGGWWRHHYARCAKRVPVVYRFYRRDTEDGLQELTKVAMAFRYSRWRVVTMIWILPRTGPEWPIGDYPYTARHYRSPSHRAVRAELKRIHTERLRDGAELIHLPPI